MIGSHQLNLHRIEEAPASDPRHDVWGMLGRDWHVTLAGVQSDGGKGAASVHRSASKKNCPCDATAEAAVASLGWRKSVM